MTFLTIGQAYDVASANGSKSGISVREYYSSCDLCVESSGAFGISVPSA